jgi:hypothetical protein
LECLRWDFCCSSQSISSYGESNPTEQRDAAANSGELPNPFVAHSMRGLSIVFNGMGWAASMAGRCDGDNTGGCKQPSATSVQFRYRQLILEKLWLRKDRKHRTEPNSPVGKPYQSTTLRSVVLRLRVAAIRIRL